MLCVGLWVDSFRECGVVVYVMCTRETVQCKGMERIALDSYLEFVVKQRKE